MSCWTVYTYSCHFVGFFFFWYWGSLLILLLLRYYFTMLTQSCDPRDIFFFYLVWRIPSGVFCGDDILVIKFFHLFLLWKVFIFCHIFLLIDSFAGYNNLGLYLLGLKKNHSKPFWLLESRLNGRLLFSWPEFMWDLAFLVIFLCSV